MAVPSRKIGSDGPRSELSAALWSCRAAFLGVGVISAMVNVLALTGSIFMLEVYDRVLPSRSVPTLVALAVAAGMLFVFQGVLEIMRGRVLVRIGSYLDASLGSRVFDAVVRLPLRLRAGGDGLQPLRDLDQIRGFLSGSGPTALFDLPWMPLFLGICFLFHPLIGLTALIGGVVLIILTAATELLSRKPTRETAVHGSRRYALLESGRRNAEVLRAMGMSSRIGAVWGQAGDRYRGSNERAADVGGGLGSVSRVLRMVLQSAVLGVGGYLVIQQEATAGIMIASSILTTRALAPVELAIGHWRGFIGARQSWGRLSELFEALKVEPTPMDLPRPKRALSVESLSVVPPGDRKVVVHQATFAVKAGSAVGVIGQSGSGKSSLARALVGAWAPARGVVRLDGAALEHWPLEALGRHVGYLPQDVELFSGTVAQNIARFDPEAAPEAIIAAAEMAGVHQLVLRLPEGYDTEIGEGGAALSAGQRQRVALARALYGDPFLLVLDEPNSNLDAEGEEALTRAILAARSSGRIVIVVAHRPSALAAADLVLVMNDGRIEAFGAKDEVLARVLRRPPAAAAAAAVAGAGARPLKLAAAGEGSGQ